MRKMKKIALILIATLGLSSVAMAAEQGISVEFERERGTEAPNTMTNTVKVAPFYKLDNGVKFDVQLGASRDDGSVSGNNNPISNTAEARVQYMYEVAPSFKLGGRLGIGEMFNGVNSAGKTVDFSYYTVEPKAEYMITPELSALASWRYRDSFSDGNNYQTRTWKAGFGYAVTKKDEIEVKYFEKRGDDKTNGVELAYTRSF
jgi:Outer membrane protein beta-barrel domain